MKHRFQARPVHSSHCVISSSFRAQRYPEKYPGNRLRIGPATLPTHMRFPEHSVASHGFASKISLVFKKRPYSSMPFSASSCLWSRVQKHVSPTIMEWYSSPMLADWKKCQSSPNTSASSFFWTILTWAQRSRFAPSPRCSRLPCSAAFSRISFPWVTFKTQQWLVCEENYL